MQKGHFRSCYTTRQLENTRGDTCSNGWTSLLVTTFISPERRECEPQPQFVPKAPFVPFVPLLSPKSPPQSFELIWLMIQCEVLLQSAVHKTPNTATRDMMKQLSSLNLFQRWKKNDVSCLKWPPLRKENSRNTNQRSVANTTKFGIICRC